jgi:Phage terminase large subunit (GpA)
MPNEVAATVQDVLRELPRASVKETLTTLSKVDPYIWTVIHRRLKGMVTTYEVQAEIDLAIQEKRSLATIIERHRPFLIQPLTDLTVHKVYKKGRQVGVSELGINEVLWFLATHPKTKWVTCVPHDAEILTRRGWLTYKQVTLHDEALALDPVTHQSRWEKILDVQHWNWHGDLLPAGNFHTTPDHRWPVDTRNQKTRGFDARIQTTETLKQHDRLIRCAPHEHDGGESVLTPRLAAILGWVVTDGHQWMTGNTRDSLNTVMMQVSQTEKKHLKVVEALLKNERHGPGELYDTGRMGRVTNRNWRVTVRREDVNTILASGYQSKADLPDLVTRLSPAAAEAMFQAMSQADGCRTGPKLASYFFASTNRHTRDAFQILCALTGRAANLNARGAYVIEPGTKHERIKPSAYQTPARRYKGIVWCPSTPSGTWFMRYEGNVVFTGNTFPREKQLTDFSNTRFNEALKETPKIAALLGIPNQIYTKKIGESFLILRSAWESNLGEGVDADGVTFDEVDRMRPNVSQAFEESLQSSPYKFVREVSTPSLPGRGIDKSFEMSCQYHWFVRCTKCSRMQMVKWPDNVVAMRDVPLGTKLLEPGTYEYLCRNTKCRGKLDRLRGEWVPKYRDRMKYISGYHIPQTIMPWQDATALMQKKIKYRLSQPWINYCLGECAIGERTFVSQEMIARSIAPTHRLTNVRGRHWDYVTVGIDWGERNWVVVWGRNAYNQRIYVIGFGVFEDSVDDPFKIAHDVLQFIQPFEPDCIVADAGYGRDRNAHLAKAFPDIFFACYYNPHDKTSRNFAASFHPSTYKVLADRTVSIKQVVQMIRKMEIGLPEDDYFIDLLTSHFLALAPLTMEEDGEIYETIEKVDDDHLVHCMAYNAMALAYVEGSQNDFQATW